MNYSNSVPKDLQDIINKEDKIDFLVKSDKYETKYNGISLILLWLIWLIWNIYTVIIKWNTLLPDMEKEIKVYWIASAFAVWLCLTFYGLYRIMRDGGYFVWTSDKLIRYMKWNITNMNWKDFKNIVDIKGDTYKWRILMFNDKVAKETYSSVTISNKGLIYMWGIDNYQEIWQLCKKRIEENIKSDT